MVNISVAEDCFIASPPEGTPVMTGDTQAASY
jgi:hypothetical protein